MNPLLPYYDSSCCDTSSISAFLCDISNQYLPFMMQSMTINSMFNGDTGSQCSNYIWCIGPTGPTGPSAPQQLISATSRDMSLSGYTGTCRPGPVGTQPARTGQTFISVYSIIEQHVDQGKPILFDMHSAIYGYCFHEPNTSDIWIWKPGFYSISINVYSVDPMQLSLVKNETTIIPGTTTGSLTGLSAVSTTGIIYICINDMTMEKAYSPSGYGCKLQVVNNTTYTPYITLYGSTSSDSTIHQNTATFTIIRIA